MTRKQQPLTLVLKWNRDLEFEAKTEPGCLLVLDGKRQAGSSPMEALLAALCGCMAIDVVHILGKMKADLRDLRVAASAFRNGEPPRSFRKIEMEFAVAGRVAQSRLERAIRLSFDKYCSVLHSLRKDMDVSFSIRRLDRLDE